MLSRTLLLTVTLIGLSALPALADASASPGPASPVPSAAAASGPAKELYGSYAVDFDFLLEQQPGYDKFTAEQKKEAHDKAVGESPKVELEFADRIKISEGGVPKLDASYKVLKHEGAVFSLEMTDSLAKDKKPEVYEFDLTGARLKMKRSGDKEPMVWHKTGK